MEHVESSIKVFFTKDYSRFRMINGNRQLNETKIKKIVNDIDNGVDVLRFCPVLVRQNGHVLDIVDGQHRYYVSRKMKCGVWYILAEDMSLYDIAKINSNTEKWKGKDFINCYTQLGNDNYKKLQEILDKYPVPLTTAISMLQSGKVNNGGHTKEPFERGEFSITHYDSTVKIFEYCININFSHKFSRQFVKALSRVLESGKINIEDLVVKINEDPTALTIHADWKNYLTNLENIFNKGKKNRIVIY